MIRKEVPEDIGSVRKVNLAAFPTEVEANLVDRLRLTIEDYISLVGIQDNRVIGHILFSPVTISQNPNKIKACGLAPMAVLPEVQRQGMGLKLVKAGLEACKSQGYQAVVVLGHPKYYPRFGFERAAKYGIRCDYDVAEAFMVLELETGALQYVSGIVKYHRLFDEI